MKMKTKINLSLINIISIFIVIIIIGYVLIPWSKSNTEHFTVEIRTDIPKDASYITLFDYILESRKFSIDFENRIKELKKVLESGGVLKKEDYIEIIEEVKKKINNDDDFRTKQVLASHLLNQNNKEETIDNLKNQINDLTNKIQSEVISVNSSQPVQSFGIKNKTIKSVKYGLSLSIKELLNGKIMIHLNNGCLTYDKENPNKEYYSVRHCEITNDIQHFIVRDNTNNSVISPVSNLNLFLKIDDNGLSLEPYTQIYTQPPGSVMFNHPDEFSWIVLPFETNTCKKFEEKKITIK
jgi:hypothetical protein